MPNARLTCIRNLGARSTLIFELLQRIMTNPKGLVLLERIRFGSLVCFGDLSIFTQNYAVTIVGNKL